MNTDRDDKLVTALIEGALADANGATLVCTVCGHERSCMECSTVPSMDLRHHVRALCAALVRDQVEKAELRKRLSRERTVNDHRNATIRSADHYFHCVQDYVRWVTSEPRDPLDPNDTSGRMIDAAEHFKTTRDDLNRHISRSSSNTLPDDKKKLTDLVEALRRIRFAKEDDELVAMVQRVSDRVGNVPETDEIFIQALRQVQQAGSSEAADAGMPLSTEDSMAEGIGELLDERAREADEVPLVSSDVVHARLMALATENVVKAARSATAPHIVLQIDGKTIDPTAGLHPHDAMQELRAMRTLFERTSKLLSEAREHIIALQTTPPRRFALWDPKTAEWVKAAGKPVVWDHEGQARDAATAAFQQSNVHYYEVRPFEVHYGTNDFSNPSLRTRVEKYWKLRCEYYDMWKEDFEMLQEAWRWVSYARQHVQDLAPRTSRIGRSTNDEQP